MLIAIMGAGRVGKALGGALRRAGHQVIFGVRTPDPGSAQEIGVAEAARRADAAILATPFDAAAEVITAASGFAGKILIDATNPLGMGAGGLGLTMGFDRSGAEHIQGLAPAASVFKAFNQTGFENMADARRYGVPPVMFVAGDDGTAKPLVMKLVDDIGFEAVDLGGLRSARLIEPFAMLWIELARKGASGPDVAFSLQRKV